MKKHLLLILLATLPMQATPNPDQLATAMMTASGALNWMKVERVRFTFRVVVDGVEKVSAKHNWNVATDSDAITWEGKTVNVNLQNPGISPDEKAAFQRWTNDAYWLLAPLKIKDPGTELSQPAENSLEISFKAVGLTPGDHYVYELNPATHLPTVWTYMPNPSTKKLATWEKYVTSGGLTLSTYHKMGNIEIYIDGLDVSAKP